MNLTDLQQEAHAIAKEHGWWDEERTFGDLIALGVCPRIRSWRRKPPRNNLLTVIWTLSWSN